MPGRSTTQQPPAGAGSHHAHARDATLDAAVERPGQTQLRFKWRGKGWLAIASSRWQVLGCSADPSPGNPDAWAVTYFEKTLFTPAGLDVYARTPRGLPEALVRAIMEKAKALGGDVAKLAEGFFEVERSAGAKDAKDDGDGDGKKDGSRAEGQEDTTTATGAE